MDLDKKYTLDYVLKNPPPTQGDAAKKNKKLWKEAVFKYLKKIGIKKPEKLNTAMTFQDIKEDRLTDKRKKVKQLALFPEMVRIFNQLAGLENRKRSPSSKKRKKKMKDIKEKLAGMVVGEVQIFREGE